MEALELLQTRNSVPRLEYPGPNSEQIDEIIAAAVRASDHRRLRPWRFIVVQGAALETLGALFLDAYRADNPQATEEELLNVSAKASRAPLVIVSVQRNVTSEQVPFVEQVLSAGGATQMMVLAADALGFGSIWRTGSMAYHAGVHRGLGLSKNESIVGFVYIGTAQSKKPLASLKLEEFRTYLEAPDRVQ